MATMFIATYGKQLSGVSYCVSSSVSPGTRRTDVEML